MDEESFGQIRDAVRRFVRERVMPREDEIETMDAVPDDLPACTGCTRGLARSRGRSLLGRY